MNILDYNRAAWDREVEHGNQWTIPVSHETIEAARRGVWDIVLTPTKPVPKAWFGAIEGREILCLASGGGQQGPILAAAGAQVTVFDNSPKQLAQDCFVAERESLNITTVQGDMADLSAFANESFDLIIHPCSNCFAPAVRPVWKEAFRVLRHGGALLAGFSNPVSYIFDADLAERGIFEVKYSLPYSDIEHEETRQRYMDRGEALEFSHTLDDQIGGQLDAGFLLAGFFEDYWPERPISSYLPIFIATRAVKL